LVSRFPYPVFTLSIRISIDSNRIRGTTKEIEAATRRLRQELTPGESVLWEVLRSRQFEGLKFRSQHPVGRFIMDFYCPSLKLVIEIDGNVHDDRKVYDRARTEQLQTFGYYVLRFSNDRILNDLSTVLIQIAQTAKNLAL
jgi:very-short-patch-repair endonuclease